MLAAPAAKKKHKTTLDWKNPDENKLGSSLTVLREQGRLNVELV